MNKKKVKIIVTVICILLFIFILWSSEIIPKQIARISSNIYLKKNFPKMQLEYESIEWNQSFGDYIIKYKGDNELYSFCIGPKYFPINVGQGIFELEEEYRQKYADTVNEQNQTSTTAKDDNSFVGTVLEETTTYMIVEPNEDEIERKIADKIKINYENTENRDYLYGVGRKVIISYTGSIKETYPPQIDTDDILTDGYEEFELTVKTAESKNITKILNNKELYKNNADYDLYYYGIDEVKITINNKTMLLEEALRSGKMTIDGLIIKANKDFPNTEVYKDGGSMEYHYGNYTIIKLHKLDGNRDVYIGKPNLTLSDLKI